MSRGRSMVTMTAGHALETLLLPPNRPSESGARLAVLLHPWSWLGGSMNDPVLRSLVDPLHAENYHVLLYNSRGVGKSTGRSSFTGNSESDDLQELVQKTLEERVPDIQRLLIVGYSHGSMIASRFPVLQGVQTSHALISYPLAYRAALSLFSSSVYQNALLALVRNPSSTVLLVHGDKDDFTSMQRYSPWTESLRAEAAGSLTIEVVPQAGHFWSGQSIALLHACLVNWLRRQRQ